jgi:uncharacterized membrane protein HdeD (DUF308 family)
MSGIMSGNSPLSANTTWLRNLYLVRAAFCAIWVALTFAVATSVAAVASILLVLYPAWDALANAADARRFNGTSAGWAPIVNACVSVAAAVGMAVAVNRGMPAVFLVFGTWAIVAGLLQLGTAVRRWGRFGAQWPMALSGAQSALAGGFFVNIAEGPMPKLQILAGYAAMGGVYFAVAAALLVHRQRKARREVQPS